ncbi:hypothetical protein [Bacillus salacetis]|nr:hypothetical protein [Bacillus salacetis]
MTINIEELAKKMPAFDNHQEASEWFGDKFNERSYSRKGTS